MQPTHNAPAGSHGNDTAPNKPKLDAPLSSNEPTSGPAGSSYRTYEEKRGQQPDPQPQGQQPQPPQPPRNPQANHAPGSPDQRIQTILDSGFQNRAASRPGRDAHDVADTAKDLGSKAMHGIKTMSISQIALAVGVVAAGIAFFATRGKKKRNAAAGEYRPRPQRSPFDHQRPHGRNDDGYGQGGRPWGTSRYAGPSAGRDRPRVQSGSGYGPQGARRDQGPASGSRYNPRASGRQNPNNLDDLNSAF